MTLSVFSHFFTFAVSAVSVWLGIALCFTASNLYSVPLFIQNSLPHLLLVSLHSSLALYPSFPLPVIFFPPSFFFFFFWILLCSPYLSTPPTFLIIIIISHLFLLHILELLYRLVLSTSQILRPTTTPPFPLPLPKVCVKPFDSQCSQGCCAGLNVSSLD